MTMTTDALLVRLRELKTCFWLERDIDTLTEAIRRLEADETHRRWLDHCIDVAKLDGDPMSVHRTLTAVRENMDQLAHLTTALGITE